MSKIWKRYVVYIPTQKRLVYRFETEFPHFPEKCYELYCFLKNKPVKRKVRYFKENI